MVVANIDFNTDSISCRNVSGRMAGLSTINISKYTVVSDYFRGHLLTDSIKDGRASDFF